MTRPTSLTPGDVLQAKAQAWIASNGLPSIALVEQAIRTSEAHGDPFLDNPFRRVLIDVATQQGATRYNYRKGSR